jgi:fibrillar collagen-like protein
MQKSDTATVEVSQEPVGTDAEHPGLDCMQIRDAGSSVGDGTYWIDPNGGEHTDSFQAICDMTTDGGGWTLLVWTGGSPTPAEGMPFPGLAPCPTLDCVRGSAMGAPYAEQLIQRSTEFAKTQQEATLPAPGFQPIGSYAYAGKYIYGPMTNLVLTYGPTPCTGVYPGFFRTIVGPTDFDSKGVYLNQSLSLEPGVGDFSADTNAYLWLVGAPNNFCDASGTMPGSWMGTWNAGQYGPYLVNSSGASSVWVRGGSVPEPPGTQINPGQSCLQIHTALPSAPDGVYWIGPNGSPAFEVYCDMTTAGGGWTMTYFVDSEHFDGYYGNNITASTLPPVALNSTNDVWNAENVLPFNETMLACTDDAQTSTYYWTYSGQYPQLWFDAPVASPTSSYQNNFPSQGSNTTAAGCIAETKNTSYAFMVAESSANCGSCNTMLWGMYHYPGGSGCYNAGGNIQQHLSPWDGTRTIYYPVCNSFQTTTGRLWIGVR